MRVPATLTKRKFGLPCNDWPGSSRRRVGLRTHVGASNDDDADASWRQRLYIIPISSQCRRFQQYEYMHGTVAIQRTGTWRQQLQWCLQSKWNNRQPYLQ